MGSTVQAPADTLLTFIRSVGSRADVDLYVDLFRRLNKESFAVIATEATTVRHAGGSFAEQVAFLAELGLFAPIVLGLFEPAAMPGAGDELTKRLDDAGLDTVVHSADETELHRELVRELRSEKTPLILLKNDERAGRFHELGEIAHALESRKVVALRRLGALGPPGSKPLRLGPAHTIPLHENGISIINLRTDYDALRQADLLDADELELLASVRELLSNTETTPTQVSIASPLHLLRELFTVKGAGTLIKRGTPILHRSSYDGVDCQKLHELLESSFSKKLNPTFFERPVCGVYLDETYRGVAILEPGKVGAFLTKFAVDRVAQGDGIARDLWQALARNEKTVSWRARPDNPIASWYSSLCDGFVRTATWNVYWRGVEPTRIPDVVEHAIDAAADFSD